MLKARPFSPQEQLIRYIALVAEFGNQLNLSPAGRNFTYIQYWNLDILILIVALIAGLLYSTYYLLKNLFCKSVQKKPKEE